MIDRNIFGDDAAVVPQALWPKYRKLSGVYAIRHVSSGKFYVGSAVNLCRRLNSHQAHLRKNTHANKNLQNAWNKHGRDAFEFIVVALTEAEGVVALEQVWLDSTQAVARGYNFTPTAGSVLGMKLSAEAREKIASALRGKKRPAEVGAKVSASKKGVRATPKARKNQAAAQIGLKHTQAAKDKIGAAHKGRTVPEARKKAQADAMRRKGPVTPDAVSQIKQRYIKGDKINGGKALSAELGISEMTISRIVRGLTWS